MRIRGLTEGAILATIVALLALAGRFLPLVGSVAAFLCPLPVVILVIRHGLYVGILASIVAAAVATAIGGPLVGLGITTAFAPVGLAIGLGGRLKWQASQTITLTSLVTTVSTFVSLAASMFGLGVDPRIIMREMIEQSMRSQEAAVRLYERLGVDPNRLAQESAMMKQFFELLPYLIPAMLVAGAVLLALVNYVVARRVLKRLGIELPALPPVLSWGVPRPVLWFVPIAYLVMILGRGWQIPLLELAGFNITFLAQFVLMFQGLLAAWVLMDRYEFPRWFRWLILVVASSGPALIASLLGLADAAFDLRGRWRIAKEART